MNRHIRHLAVAAAAATIPLLGVAVTAHAGIAPTWELTLSGSGPATADMSTSATYSLVIANEGDISTDGDSVITVTAAVPSGLTYLSSTGAGWACSGTTTVTCSYSGDPIDQGGSSQLGLTFQVTATGPTTLTTTFTLTAAENEPTVVSDGAPSHQGSADPDHDTATWTLAVRAAATATATATATASALPITVPSTGAAVGAGSDGMAGLALLLLGGVATGGAVALRRQRG